MSKKKESAIEPVPTSTPRCRCGWDAEYVQLTTNECLCARCAKALVDLMPEGAAVAIKPLEAQ